MANGSKDRDDNKTALTHRVTAVAAAYLDGLGCKPVETEVPVRPGWVADLASFWYPTATEAKKLHMNQRAREILGAKAKNWSWAKCLPRTYGDGPLTVLVEVKTSTSDFKGDPKWKRDWPAHMCFLAVPSGIVAPGDIPEGWHGLETSKNGTCLRKVHRTFAGPHPQHTGMVVDFVAAVGIRRDHRTRYAAMRAFAKAYRAEDQQRKMRYSAERLLDRLANWIQGQGVYAHVERSLKDVLAELGIKKVPCYCEKAVAFFESLKDSQTERAED